MPLRANSCRNITVALSPSTRTTSTEEDSDVGESAWSDPYQSGMSERHRVVGRGWIPAR